MENKTLETCGVALIILAETPTNNVVYGNLVTIFFVQI
jgi:hypothetical protein